MDYSVVLGRDDEGAVLVTFPDFPEARTTGEYEADALARARQTLSALLGTYIQQRRRIPTPSPHAGPVITVPLLVEAKVRVYEAMQEGGVGRADLARRLRWHRPQVDRLLNVQHASRLDQLEAAIAALGRRFRLNVEDHMEQGPRSTAHGPRPKR